MILDYLFLKFHIVLVHLGLERSRDKFGVLVRRLVDPLNTVLP
jgi:hypothetical protein